jgi:predicted PurR-regulated permease PerM
MPIARLNLPEQNGRQVFETIATFAIIVAILYVGAGILVPLVLAVLLAFALTPLVDFFGRRLHLPDIVAVILSVLIAALALGAFAYLVGTQLMHLAQDFPKYQATVTAKLQSLQTQLGKGGFIDHALETIQSMLAQFNGSSGSNATGASRQPVPVTISNNVGSPLGVVGSLLGSVLGPLATAAIVTVLLIFLLLGRGDLKDRFLRLVSRGGYSTTTMAISDASTRVGRYLLLQFAVNLVYGTLFGIGLTLIGVPGAVLWGSMIVLFRYIPFVGALITAAIPFLLAFAVDPGWSMLAMTVGLYLVLDLTVTNAVEPRLYGSSTGVSPIALLLAALFWATLWGPIGLILSTPMTVCLVVLGRYMPQFQVFETLLGSEPVLEPAERFYQRLLKGDTEEAIEIADDLIEADGKDALYDDMMLPALRLATAELSDSPEGLAQRRQLATSIEGVIDEYGEIQQVEGSPVLLVGGRTEIDECAARIVAQRLVGRGIASRVLPPMAVRQESIGRIDLDGVSVVCLFNLGENVRTQTRYVARRLRRLQPGVTIIACNLGETATGETTETLRVDQVAPDFEKAIVEIEGALDTNAPGEKDEGAPAPFEGAGRGDDALGRALEQIADELGVPLATINLLADERHQDDADAFRLTQKITSTGEPLVIQVQSAKDGLDANPYLLSNGVELYAGVPLTLADGETVGTLTIMDYDQHEFGEAELERLKAYAADLVERFGNVPASPAPPPPAVPAPVLQETAANLSSKL